MKTLKSILAIAFFIIPLISSAEGMDGIDGDYHFLHSISRSNASKKDILLDNKVVVYQKADTLILEERYDKKYKYVQSKILPDFFFSVSPTGALNSNKNCLLLMEGDIICFSSMVKNIAYLGAEDLEQLSIHISNVKNKGGSGYTAEHYLSRLTPTELNVLRVGGKPKKISESDKKSFYSHILKHAEKYPEIDRTEISPNRKWTMPKEGETEPDLVKDIQSKFQSQYGKSVGQSYNNKINYYSKQLPQFLGTYSHQNDWKAVYKGEIEKVLSHRKKYYHVFYKDEFGCHRFQIMVKQNYNGTDFSKNFRISNKFISFKTDCDCNTIESYFD